MMSISPVVLTLEKSFFHREQNGCFWERRGEDDDNVGLDHTTIQKKKIELNLMGVFGSGLKWY
jgi:hypothetical protein